MVAAVFAALESVKTDISPFAGMKFLSRKSPHRTGIHANMTLAAGFVDYRPCGQGSLCEHGNKADPGAEAIRQKQATFPNPAYSRQMGSQFVRKDSFQFFKVVGH